MKLIFMICMYAENSSREFVHTHIYMLHNGIHAHVSVIYKCTSNIDVCNYIYVCHITAHTYIYAWSYIYTQVSMHASIYININIHIHISADANNSNKLLYCTHVHRHIHIAIIYMIATNFIHHIHATTAPHIHATHT